MRIQGKLAQRETLGNSEARESRPGQFLEKNNIVFDEAIQEKVR
jgi:hypothetical protein